MDDDDEGGHRRPKPQRIDAYLGGVPIADLYPEPQAQVPIRPHLPRGRPRTAAVYVRELRQRRGYFQTRGQ